MQKKWQNTKYAGVKYREHDTRKIRNNNVKDRYYCIYYRLNGKLKWEAIGWESQGATPERANQELVERKLAIREGKKVVTLRDKRNATLSKSLKQKQHKTTLREFWEKEYFPYIESIYKENSLKRTKSIFACWLLPKLGNIPINKVSQKDWEELRHTLTTAKLAQRTRAYIAGELRRILKSAKERGYPIKNIPSEKQTGMQNPTNNRRERIITPNESILILDALQRQNINAYYITKFAFLTGSRFSECAKLKWENITQENIILMNTKNKQNRKIPLSQPILDLLAEMTPKIKSGIVFLNSNSTPYTQPPEAFDKVVKQLNLNENRDKLDKITFHSIRHTVATKLSGILDIRSLMDFMGWKRVEMAARYIHSNSDSLKAAAELLNVMLTSPKSER